MTGTRRARWQPAALLLPLSLLGCTKQAPPGERIYVSNEHGNTVSVIDAASDKLVQTIDIGRRPRGLALSPDKAKLYVAISGSPIGGPGVDESKLPPADRSADGIAVIDVASGKRDRVLKAGADPETFALSADARTLFVSNEDAGEVSAVSTDGSHVTVTRKVGEQPEGVAVTPDGAHLFVACEASDRVTMLDGRSLQVSRTIPLKGRPRGALMSRDGGTVFISVENAGIIAAISTADGAVQQTIDVASGDKNVRPMGMVEGPDRHLFVTTGRAGVVFEIDPANGKVLRRLTNVGARPWGIALSGDGQTLVSANGPSNDITLIDRATLAVKRHVAAGAGPWGVTE